MTETEATVLCTLEAMLGLLPHVEEEALAQELAQIIRDAQSRGTKGDRNRAILTAILKFCPPARGDTLSAILERADAIYADAHACRDRASATLEGAETERRNLLYQAERQAAGTLEVRLTEERARLDRLEAHLIAEREAVAAEREALRAPYADVRLLFTDLIRAAGYGTGTPVPSVALCGAFAALGSLMGSNPVSINVSTTGTNNTGNQAG